VAAAASESRRRTVQRVRRVMGTRTV